MSLWKPGDAAAMEAILSEVTDTGVPRIREALQLLASALNGEQLPAVALQPLDPVLTDAMRCLLCHTWLVPSVAKKNAQGETVQSLFTQPFQSARILSLYSSSKAYESLLREAARAGLRLLPAKVSLGQVLMAHLPNLSREALAKRPDASESDAVIAIALDPETQMRETAEGAESEMDNLIVFAEAEFAFLQSYCHCYGLAGQVLQVQEAMSAGPQHVSAKEWDEVLGRQALSVVMAGEAVFANEHGLLFFCYPGDASKALAHHQRKGTTGLDTGKVRQIDPDELLELLKWAAGRGKSALLAATVLEQGDQLQIHGLSLPPYIFTEFVLPALMAYPGD